MSELQHYYQEVACGNAWADYDADVCGCGGRGWWLSQVDTWHKCPYHGKGVEHPESMDEECDDNHMPAEEGEFVMRAHSPAVAPVVSDVCDDDIPF